MREIKRKKMRRKRSHSKTQVCRGERRDRVITIPVTTSRAVCAVILDFLSSRAKAVPKGLMGRHRSTTLS